MQTSSPIKSETKELFERKRDGASVPVTKHIYESIDECYEYEPAVIVTPTQERVKVKNTK